MITLNVFQNVIISLLIIFGVCIPICSIYVAQVSKRPKWFWWVIITLPLETEFFLFILEISGITKYEFLFHRVNIYGFLALLALWLVMVVSTIDKIEDSQKEKENEQQKKAWVFQAFFGKI